MLFYVFHLCIFSDKETVNSIVLRFLVSAVVNTAACHNHHISPLSYIEVVIHRFRQTALAENHRDMNAFMFCKRPNFNINSAPVLFGYNVNIGCRGTLRRLSISPDIVCSLRDLVESGYLLQDSHLDCIYLLVKLSHFLILLHNQRFSTLQASTADAVPIIWGRISSRLPFLAI